jgi:hypothetical protein
MDAPSHVSSLAAVHDEYAHLQQGFDACEGGEHSVGDSAGLHTFLRDDILASTRKMRLAHAHTVLRCVEL